VEAVRWFLDELRPLPPVVLDPVMRSTSGAALIEEGGDKLLRSFLPFVSLVTPNLSEAELLTGHEVRDLDAMKRAGEELRGLGARAVLVKGGHLPGEPADVLLYEGGTRQWRSARLPREYHGTGCALASAIAAGLAHGLALAEAVERGRSYLLKCMRAARPGKGKAYILDFPGPG
jgi:hydroxymethylpyrimidine/phosphomethylpyrimidine kinase